MSQLKQPGFLKKIEKAISAIPGLEDQLFSFRKKKRSDNPWGLRSNGTKTYAKDICY